MEGKEGEKELAGNNGKNIEKEVNKSETSKYRYPC
jgi:hypothetical protein